MSVGIIQIVLPGVVFRNNGICCQIKKETGVLPNQAADDLIKMISGNDLADHYKCSDPETDAPISFFTDFRKFRFREVFQEAGIGMHRLR